MTFISLTDCCRLLGIDPKTLRRWLAQAQFPLQPHPGDGRLKGLTGEQLRLLATAHHRSLPALPGELASLAPAGPAQQLPPLPPELLDLLQQLTQLPAQLAALQQQLACLTQRLDQPSPPPVVSAPRSQPRAGSVREPGPPQPEARSRRAASSATKSRRPPAHVLPLVEYVREGTYVVICPKAGLLSLEPESPEWFAWLATLSSFRFVGKAGRLTAHREVERVKRAPWRAHRNIRNHTSNLPLGPTEDLTIAALEQAAATLQAHLS